MNAKQKQILQVVIALSVTALGLFLALRGIDFRQVSQALQQVNWIWMTITLLLNLVTLGIRAQRWRILLGKKVSFPDSFGLIGVGYMVSGILPLRAGDPARAFAASLRGPISAIAALSTVVVERVLDMFLIVIILVSTLPFVPGLQTYLTSDQGDVSFNLILVLSGVLAFGLLVTFILVALYPNQIESLLRRALETLHIPNPDVWLSPVKKVLEGLRILSSPRAGLEIALWSLALWVMTVGYFFTALLACQAFIPGASPLQGTVATWASAFGMVFPATGGIGSFHFAVREALFWGFDIARDLGFTYAVIVHAVAYICGVLLGAGTLIVWGISLKSLVSKK